MPLVHAKNPLSLRGVKPRNAELTVLTSAIAELRQYTKYEATFGPTAPNYDQLVAVADIASQWSVMRNRAKEWDAYCAFREQQAWKQLRALMAALRPPFEMYVKFDRSLEMRLPRLSQLLRAMSTIAHKAAASRRANEAARAEGKVPTRGKRAKAAAKKGAPPAR